MPELQAQAAQAAQAQPEEPAAPAQPEEQAARPMPEASPARITQLFRLPLMPPEALLPLPGQEAMAHLAQQAEQPQLS